MEEENGKAIWPSLWPVHLLGPPARSRPSSLPRPPWSSSIRLAPSSAGPRAQQLADLTRATSPAARPSYVEARSSTHDQAAQQAMAQPGQQPHAPPTLGRTRPGSQPPPFFPSCACSCTALVSGTYASASSEERRKPRMLFPSIARPSASPFSSFFHLPLPVPRMVAACP